MTDLTSVGSWLDLASTVSFSESVLELGCSKMSFARDIGERSLESSLSVNRFDDVCVNQKAIFLQHTSKLYMLKIILPEIDWFIWLRNPVLGKGFCENEKRIRNPVEPNLIQTNVLKDESMAWLCLLFMYLELSSAFVLEPHLGNATRVTCAWHPELRSKTPIV